MINIFKTITNISLTIIFTMMFTSNIFASEVDVNGSMYKYNVLETHSIDPDLMIGDIETLAVPVIENTNLPVDLETKIQNILDKHKFSTDKINNNINKINNNSKIRIFLIGNNLGILKFQLVQINDQILELIRLELETKNDFVLEKDQINLELKILNEEYIKVDDYIVFNEDKFSLFGWFVVLF